MKSMFKNSVLTLFTNQKFTNGQSFLNLNIQKRWLLTVSISSIPIPQRWADTGERRTADQSNHWHVHKAMSGDGAKDDGYHTLCSNCLHCQNKPQPVIRSPISATPLHISSNESVICDNLENLCLRGQFQYTQIWRRKKKEAVAERRQRRVKEGEVGTRQRTKAGRVILSAWPAGLRVNEWNVVWGPFLSERCHSCHSVCRLTVGLTEMEEEANITESCQGAVSQLFFHCQGSTCLLEAHRPASSGTVGGRTGSLSNWGRLHNVRF